MDVGVADDGAKLLKINFSVLVFVGEEDGLVDDQSAKSLMEVPRPIPEELLRCYHNVCFHLVELGAEQVRWW